MDFIYIGEVNVMQEDIEAFLTARDGSSTALHARFLEEHGLSAGDVPLVMMTPGFSKPFVPGSGYGRMGDPASAAIG